MTMTRLEAPAPGRSCGECSLCCKLPYIEHPSLNKPAAVWCRHCKPGKGGCTIYDTRPSPCRDFLCYWLALPELSDEWRPNVCKLVVCGEADGNRIAVHVDPGSPDRWREEPYYSQLKAWAEIGADNGMQVVVYLKDTATVILPNKDIDLGHVAHEDIIMVRELDIPIGRDWNAWVVPAKDVPPDQRDKWIVT
jgi:uncharacterized cysteine cluster protein YcgN (CxxCxxCC family)